MVMNETDKKLRALKRETPTLDRRLMLKPARVAELLDCSRSTVYELLNRGTLRSIHLNGDSMIRIPASAVIELMEQAS